jgi:ATP-dependent Zn protease
MHIHNKEYYLANIKVALGSYAAEMLKFRTTTSGVGEDMLQAAFWAYNMVWCWGMGSSGMKGNFKELSKNFSSFSAWPQMSFISEKTKERLDDDVQSILSQCLQEVEDLLKKESALLDRFAGELIAKEELDYDQIETIFKECGKERTRK